MKVYFNEFVVNLLRDNKLAQGKKESHYNLASTTENGKKPWIIDQGSNAIWYDKEFNNWNIGENTKIL